MTPNDRKYTKDHEWILISDRTAMIGITDHAQDALGDIVFVELPQIGDTVSAGVSFAVVESVKAASEIFTEVSGRVVTVNEALNDSPELINTDPYGTYIAELEFSKINEGALMSAEEYDAFVAQEG
ncbi:MAG: glycine cleavage system protein GcvH [Clostridia bacterium]